MENNVTVHRVVRDKKKPGQYIEPHSHTFFHYLFGVSGHVQILTSGEDVTVPPGALAMLPPGVIHSIHSLDHSCSLNIKFSCEGPLAEDVARLPLLLPRVGDYQQALLKNLMEEVVLQQAGSADLVSLWIYELLIRLCRMETGGALPSLPTDSMRKRRLQKALDLIAVQPELSVKELAAACGYHENYFSAVFKADLGCPPRRYINLQRINRAKELLLFSDINVTEVAETLGFSSIHYFSRLFRQVTGLTPTEYLYRANQPIAVNVVRNNNTPLGLFELPLCDPFL